MSLYLPLFKALNEADVQYIVVGGIATILHGYVRATADVDLVVDLQVDEASKVISVLTREGFKPKIPVQAMEFADEKKREQWIKEKGMDGRLVCTSTDSVSGIVSTVSSDGIGWHSC